MIVQYCKAKNSWYVSWSAACTLCLLSLLLLVFSETAYAAGLPKLPTTSSAQEESVTKDKKAVSAGPVDEFDRGVPRSSIKGFLASVEKGDYKSAVEYMDMRYLPSDLREDSSRLARMLKIVFDRVFWLDIDLVSDKPKGHLNDGQPSYRDILGQIKADDKTIDILMQRVPRSDGVAIWKISNKTVSHIPLLYQHHGFSPLEEYLEGSFPDIQFLGWQAWQWASFVMLIFLAYLVAWIPTTIASHLFKKRKTLFGNELAKYFCGPLRLCIWVILMHGILRILTPSVSLRGITNASTLMYIIVIWTIIRSVDLGGLSASYILKKKDRNAALILLKPTKTALKTIIILIGFLLWLENIGIHVGTLMASLGIGGLAIALASQDMLKNLLGSIMILIDKPYEIGQRIVAKGHDGMVEEIGLRSTRIRLFSGHQVIIPNDDMARADIENIGRRPHIRRCFDLSIALDTPASKIEQAINIIKDCLDNHECMSTDYPPRVYFDKMNRDSINIRVTLWYQSTEFWAFQAFNEKLNLMIISEFEAEGVKLALPSFNTYGKTETLDKQNLDPVPPAQQVET